MGLQSGRQRIQAALGPSPRNARPTLSCPDQRAEENSAVGHQLWAPLGPGLSMALAPARNTIWLQGHQVSKAQGEGRQGQARLLCS